MRFRDLLGEWRRIRDLRRSCEQMAGVLRRPPAEVAALQERRLRDLLAYAAERSPFYRERYRGIDLARCALSDLPSVTRADVLAHFDEVVTDRAITHEGVKRFAADPANLGHLYEGRYAVCKSSGSTGLGMYTVHDLGSLRSMIACVLAREALPRQPTPRQEWEAFLRNCATLRRRRHAIIPVPGPTASNALAHQIPALLHLFSQTLVISSMDPLDAIVRRLNAYQPDTILTFATIVEQLAHERIAGRLEVALDSPMSAIVSVGEPLTESTRRAVRRAWGIEVVDSYQMSECLILGRSCKRFSGMHLMSDLCVVEPVDERGRPVPVGQAGEKILVTNLMNRALPLIRYEVTDITGISADTCDCGWPFPKLLPVEGRTNDIFWVPHPELGHEGISPYRLGFLFLIEGTKQFQLLQTAPDRATYLYVPQDANDASLEPRLRETFASKLANIGLSDRLKVEIKRVDEIPRDATSGKIRQFRSLIARPPAREGRIPEVASA